MQPTRKSKYGRANTKILASALLGAAVGYACAPIAPSLEKSTYGRPGSTLPGGIPLSGNIYQTQIVTTEPASPSQNHLALETSAVNEFRVNGQVQLLLGSLPPGGIRGLFIVDLPPSAIPSLEDFKTEMFETSLGSGVWILRVKAGVHSGISQMVRDHLQKIYLEFGVNDQAPHTTDTEVESGEDEEHSGTEVEPDTTADTEQDASGTPENEES